ncbi:MAG: hypothetical protein MJE77_16945 [Proteobacteria bacterium]|nr:hypothetical protein [Pseudomonadota bacterium]
MSSSPAVSHASISRSLFITAKHWRKVAEPLNREDRLIIEGYPFLDPDIKGICVLVATARDE